MGSSECLLELAHSSSRMTYSNIDLISFRVGSFDIMKWVVAAMLVSIRKDYENPEVFKYMAKHFGLYRLRGNGSQSHRLAGV